uniref:Uncharacterized protein n=1 Tax=virus sp. ctHG14 TaxID=2827626 RepID=A0A8S5RIR0_9VIRU|nr:MAG TPA: hypothetical protein [virus sp. ctHG14]
MLKHGASFSGRGLFSFPQAYSFSVSLPYI